MQVPGPLQAQIISRLQSAPPRIIAQLLAVTGAPIDPFNLTNSTAATVLGILGYNILATNDGITELTGQPFDNNSPLRIYRGSLNDALLNNTVARFDADDSALAQIAAHYQTSGVLRVPLITLHTTGDPIVPYWHETLYTRKLSGASALLHINIPILRYGHCNFTASEALFGFWLLVFRSSGMQIPTAAVNAYLKAPAAQTNFQNLMRQYGPANSTDTTK